MMINRYLIKVVVMSLLSACLILGSIVRGADKETIGMHLSSDSSRIDGKKGTFEYIGNANYKELGLTFTADRLIGRKDKQGRFASFTAIGSPAIFTQVDVDSGDTFVLKANKINYLILTKQLTAQDNASLKQVAKNKDSIQINASQINVNNETSKNRMIKAVGYPLILSILEKGKKDLAAEANKLAFKSSNSDLELTGDVIVKQEHGTISAGTFKYNRETKISSFEKSGGKQVEIIQTQKKP